MNEHEPFLTLSRQLLDNSLDDLDDSVLSQLKQSRKLAVNTAAPSINVPLFNFPVWLAPVSTATTFATIALTVTLFWTQPLSQYREKTHFIDDIQLLSVNEELEFYQNIEFYLWLEDEEAS